MKDSVGAVTFAGRVNPGVWCAWADALFDGPEPDCASDADGLVSAPGSPCPSAPVRVRAGGFIVVGEGIGGSLPPAEDPVAVAEVGIIPEILGSWSVLEKKLIYPYPPHICESSPKHP